MKRITTILFFTLFYSSLFGQPANDDCATLIDLGEAPICPVAGIFNNVNATGSVISTDPSLNIPTCFNGGTPDADVWFSFTMPSNGSLVDVQIELNSVSTGPNGGIVQPQMAIYRGDCVIDGLQELACIAALPGENDLEIVMTGLLPGFTYFLRIEDWSATASPNWGDFELCIKEPDQEFNMGDSPSTSLCSGTLFDSGGPTGDYMNNENFSFTICPTDPHSCININIVETNIENNFDNLTIYSGPNTSSPQFLNFTGTGGATTFGIDTDCVTIGFTSDGSVTDPGFELTWECTTSDCVSTIITCANPEVIPSLPFNMTGLSTCGTLNSQTFGACPFGLNLLDGEDYIFTYESPGEECISVALNGVEFNTAVSIYDDCPELSNNCMGAATSLMSDTAVVNSAYLQLPGTYYIVVDNGTTCTDFDITVTTVTCPDALPAAALCEDALSINGCGNLPSLIQVDQQPTTDPDCIQFGTNSGGWSGIGAAHFTWFYFQAQADGEFGFLANNGSIFEDSDIDINVWGPINSSNDICDFMKVNEPARSTYAADNPDPLELDLTGLININPTNGLVVTDEIEGAGGDGFVTTLPVIDGQWYVVLVNDFSGAIVSGGIQMDFTSTTPGVLDPNAANLTISQAMVACPNVPFQIEASGGAAYNWFPGDGLSCTDCPNPIVTVSGPTTYQVAVSTACSIDTLSVDIEFLSIDVGVDLEICQGEDLELGVQSSLMNVDWNWQGSGGTLSCTDCANPILNTTGLAAGNYEFIATATTPDCSANDTVVVTVLPVLAPTFEIADDAVICEGDDIDLGGMSVPDIIYSWTSNVGGFSSTDANPNVSPSQSTTYYLEATNPNCPNSVIDSVTVEIVQIPVIPSFTDAVICENEDVTILGIVTSPNVTYSWSPIVGVGDPNLANNIFTPTETTTYTLTAANGSCSVDESFTIEVNPIPEIMVEDITICSGMEITLNAASNATGTFTWNPGGVMGSTFSTGELNTSTTYTVSFVDDNNCVAPDATVTVNVEDGIEIIGDITTDAMEPVSQGNTIMLSVDTNPNSNVIYNWSTGGTTSTIEAVANVTPEEVFYVTVTDQYGCTDIDSISIEITGPTDQIPNIFTPDGDGVNDEFGIIINGDNIEVLNFQIYNRWGEVVHEANGENHFWDGRHKGKEATRDVYVYKYSIRLPTGEIKMESGEVTLIR